MASAPNDIRILTDRRRLGDLEAGLRTGIDGVENAYADLAEVLLEGARSLQRQAFEADFAPPPYPPAKRRAIELTLSQTREMKFRVGPPGDQS